MKLLPTLVLNVVLVAAGIFAYDQVREGDAGPAPELGGGEIDAAVLDERLAALEAERQPMLTAQGSDARLLAIVEDLERRVEALADAGGAAPAGGGAEQPNATPDAAEPTAAEIARFRKLQAAVRHEDRVRNQRQRIRTGLAKVGLELGPKQEDQVVAAYAAFQKRHGEIWADVKTRAQGTGGEVDWTVLIAETNALVQREFAGRLSSFLPAADADTVAAALYGRGK